MIRIFSLTKGSFRPHFSEPRVSTWNWKLHTPLKFFDFAVTAYSPSGVQENLMSRPGDSSMHRWNRSSLWNWLQKYQNISLNKLRLRMSEMPAILPRYQKCQSTHIRMSAISLTVACWRHMATWIWINISSDNSLLPEGTKPLTEPVVTYHRWGVVTVSLRQFDKGYLSCQFRKLA